MKNRIILLLAFCLAAAVVAGQPQRQLVEVRVTPRQWEVATGAQVAFSIEVLRDGHAVRGAEVEYSFGSEKMAPRVTRKAVCDGGAINVDAGKWNEPCFVTCQASVKIDGKSYQGMANVGVDPLAIQPVAQMPADFRDFWSREKARLKNLPLDARMTLMPERCTSRSDVYHVSFCNNRAGSRIYGILSVPRAPGRYPAILCVPGAGVRPYAGDTYLADDGFIALTIGIHGIPVTLDKEVYDAMAAGALDRYWLQSLDDREGYYYKRVYLGVVRSIDFIFSLGQFDGRSLAVTGGSQGGALSVVAAGLDERVTCYAAFYPALCDLTGYLHGRAGGWPAMFRNNKPADEGVAAKAAVSAYYDVVNFARSATAPGYFSWGYNDAVCPPTSMYAAYNAVTAPKQLAVYPETGHWNHPEQWERKQAFIKSILLAK